MHKILIDNIDINKISRSGQCFRMEQIADKPGTYSLIAFGEYIEVIEIKDGIVLSCSEEEWENRWKDYFDCGTDYGKIYKMVDTSDHYMLSAVTYGKGIRILRQELFEIIITFIISQQNNISRIRKCVDTICSRFGEERYNFRGDKYFAFPTPQRLAESTVEELRTCNLGYRSRYIKESARMIVNGEVDIEALIHMDYESAGKELLKLCGVGIKVAECICLFALHHVDAFPIDTHIQAVLRQYYPQGFPFDKYKGYAGILQQYAFYFDLTFS